MTPTPEEAALAATMIKEVLRDAFGGLGKLADRLVTVAERKVAIAEAQSARDADRHTFDVRLWKRMAESPEPAPASSVTAGST